MTRKTGVTTVTASTATRPNLFPNVQSQTFSPQQTTLCQSLKTLALIMALIFKILELVVKTKSMVMGNNNNALRHHLSNNNNNHLSFQITRESLRTWKDKSMNKKVSWMKH
jgi:hypothetical protein